jgi:hypothetical protein
MKSAIKPGIQNLRRSTTNTAASEAHAVKSADWLTRTGSMKIFSSYEELMKNMNAGQQPERQVAWGRIVLLLLGLLCVLLLGAGSASSGGVQADPAPAAQVETGAVPGLEVGGTVRLELRAGAADAREHG